MMNKNRTNFLESLQCERFKLVQEPESKGAFLSKIFSRKNKQKKIRGVKSPPRALSKSPERIRKRSPRPNSLSPHRLKENVFLVPEGELLYTTGPVTVVDDSRNQQPQYNLCVQDATVLDQPEHETLAEDVSNNHQTYFEVVKVEDLNSGSWDKTGYMFIETQDKAMETLPLEECFSQTCKKEKELLNKELQLKEETNKFSLNEGQLLLEDIEKLKRHLSNYGIVPELFNNTEQLKLQSPSEFLHFGRTCLIELGKSFIASQKQLGIDMQKLKDELTVAKNEKTEKDVTMQELKLKLETLAIKESQEHHDSLQLQNKAAILEETAESRKKILKEMEKSYRGKLNMLESDLASQKQANDQLTKMLEDKARIIVSLEEDLEKSKNSIEETKQEIKDNQCSYQSQTAKLELEHSNKMAMLCENQTTTNKQLSQALQESSKFVSQLQDAKAANAELLAEKNSLLVRIAMMDKELMNASERFVTMERKLARETREVSSLKSEMQKFEELKEQELLSIDGDIWLQLMQQQDQNILGNLQASLIEMENDLEILRAQGDCALKDFESAEAEFQQRQYQFRSLKDIFLDFETKRESIVQEQREFYSKMSLLTKKTISRDVFFKNLIQECQMKSCKIEELEERLKNVGRIMEEEKKIFEAQLKAMQSEMEFTLEKLVEFEKQIKMKDMQLQDVIKVFDQEKKLKTAAEEVMQTYKMLLEDSKKENAQLRNRINHFEDLEKNLTRVPKLKDEPSKEAQEIEELENKVKILAEDKKYLERILLESQKGKELLQKDQEDLYKKLRHALSATLQSKEDKEALELKLNKRLQTIKKLEERQADTEEKLDVLKEILHEMKRTIEVQDQEKYELQHKLDNLPESDEDNSAMHYELMLLQKEKALLEDQFLYEKGIFLHRLSDNEDSINQLHEQLKVLKERMNEANGQLQQARDQLVIERHQHTQQMLTLQEDKKKLQIYIEELEGRVTYDSRWRQETSGKGTITPRFYNATESYQQRYRGDFKKPYHR